MNWQLGVYEKSMPNELTLEQKLMSAQLAGFDYMELSIDESDEKLARLNWGPGKFDELAAAQRSAGIPVLSICLSGHRRFPLGDPDPTVQHTSLEIMEKAISFASKAGIRIIQIAGYDVYYKPSNQETQQIFHKNLCLAAEMAAKAGVILGFETMETSFMDTVQKTMHWVKRINSPYLQVYPDSGNLWNASLLYDLPVWKDLEQGAGHIVAMHLKESLPGLYREIPYGEGHVDFPQLICRSLALGVRLYTAEFWYTGQVNWRQIMHDNCRLLHHCATAACTL